MTNQGLKEDVFGFTMKISSPEDTILSKLKWIKLSGGSQKQFIDALRVYEVQYQTLDVSYIEKWVTELNVIDIWKELKKNAQPID